MNITEESLSSPEFENISCDSNGLTRFGFMQLMNRYSEEEISEMMHKLGYDENLYSIKSRVFTITFHSAAEVRIRIGNAAKTDLNEKAMSLMMADYLDRNGARKAREDRNVVVFKKYHEHAYANSYAAVNKTNSDVEVNIDMTHSTNCMFSPSSGKSRVFLPAKSLKYIGSSIVDPNADSFTVGFSFSSNKLN